MNAKRVTNLDCQGVGPQQASLGRSLSAREVQVLRFIMEGHSNKEIASMLFVSPDTVKAHLKRVFTKLGVKDRTTAVIQALRFGILHLEGISIERKRYAKRLYLTQ